MTPFRFALVTSSYRGDYERCRLLCDSIDRYVSGHDRHYILVEAADVALFESLAGPRRRIVSERDLLPWWLHPIDDPIKHRRLWLSPVGPPLRGWHVQQLRRIAMASAMDEDVMVSLDSDVVFVKPFDVSSLAEGGAVRFYRVPNGLADVSADLREEHRLWSRRAGKLLGIAAPPETAATYITTLIAWRRDTVQAMVAAIETATGRSAMRALAGTRQLSECTIYGRFVDEREKRPERHRASVEKLCAVYWGGPALDEASLRAFFEKLGPEQVAVGVQSFTGTDPMLIRLAAGIA